MQKLKLWRTLGVTGHLMWQDLRRPLRRWLGGITHYLWVNHWISTGFLHERIWLIDCIVEYEWWHEDS